MEELQLNDQLFNELQDYIRARMLSANTFRTYSYALNKLFKDHKVLSQNNMNKILDKIAQEKYGEFGFSTCTDEQQMEIITNNLKLK